MSTEESGSARERELRLTVAQLRQQLEEEKRARKRDHSDKVRDLKAAREREQEAAKETIEELKMKQQREKAQEMTVLQERMTRDFKAQVKEIQRKNEEEKHGLQKELEKERRNFKEQRKAIEKEIQRQMRQAQEAEQKKVAQEMFAMSNNVSDMEVKLRDTQDADRTKDEVIREMKAEHRAELESLSHSSRLSNRQQLEELSASQRERKEKDREISAHMERIRRLEADNDKLRDEVRTLRRAESWAKSSVTPPTLTPSTSVGDITSPPRQYTPKERDMVLKNTELSFRVRQLEEKNSELERFKRELKELLEKAKAEQKPLKEQLAKQGVRVNSLSASLHDKEKLVKGVTEENEELKKANRQLTQEQSQQKQRLTQQMTQTHTQRMEHQRALGKYADLQKLHKKLQLRVRELEHQRRSHSHQTSAASSPSGGGVWGVGGEPCSPSVSFSSLASVTEEGDTQHITAKYTEMKTEYKKVKDHYKVLKISYEKLESKYRLAEQEKLTIESEISQLRASPINERDSPYDTARSSSILSENQARLEALQSRVKDLEAYILEQENLVSKEREEHAREVSSLTEARDQLQEKLRGVGGWEEREEGEGEEVSAGNERSRELLEQLDRVEEMNRKTSGSLKETMKKTKELEECGNQMDETLQGIRTLDTLQGEEEEEEEEGGLEREGSLLVLRKARETLKECQELLRSGQDVSQVVERLADVLGVDRPLSLLEDTSLAMTTSDLEPPTPVDSSTPATAHSSLVAQIARLQEELSEKQEVVEKAQEKVAGLQTLTVELGRQLEEEREERENLVATWDQEMADLQAQVSQRETQLKRVRRAIPQGVNEQMHQQLGQQVLHDLQQCKSLAEGLTGSQALLSQLEVLETSLDSLLHTVFPGMFQQPTSPPPPLPSPPRPHTSSTTTAEPSQSTNENGSVAGHQDPSSPPPATTGVPTDHPPASSITSSRHSTPHSDQVEVTPLSSPSSHTPPQSPETEVPHLLVGTATKPSPPNHTPPHYPTLPSSPLHETTGKATPPGPVEEVMVMRHVECEEISIPLDFLIQTTPTDSTHSEPHPSHTPPKSPVHTESETDSHSTSNDLNTTVEDIGQLVERSEDGPSYSAITSAMAGEKGGEPEEVQVTEGIPQRDNPLFNGPTHPPTPDLTLIGGREYTKEDLDEVDLGTSGEYSMGASGEYSRLIRTSSEYGGTRRERGVQSYKFWVGRKEEPVTSTCRKRRFITRAGRKRESFVVTRRK
ncbi:Janus kinase and microtubule-interacting protein 3 [Geodia barretti]|uniref:Janus kinase and microtubule-interacting protein 3 n=1 Tax=Geodia barretti TaxID=519541 RepID=A0AA35RN35_GEOBA|nr:Janus kinase and microtubule-interacting protein 3 [Geodia barretti]